MSSINLGFLDFVALIAFLVFAKAYWTKHRKPYGLPYPPGPMPLPLVGNIFDILNKNTWKTYAKWGKTYGAVVSFTVLGQRLVILNSHKAAKDLLDKRGEIYSDRPVVPVFKIMGVDWWNIVFTSYSHEWRAQRRVSDRSLRPSAALLYRPMQRRYTHDFLKKLLHRPEALDEHIAHLTGAIVINLAYGYEIAESNDRFVSLAEEISYRSSAVFLPGATLVNALPILRHLPAWVPGMRFKGMASETARIAREMVNAPYEYVKEAMRDGTARPSLTRDNLNACQGIAPTEQEELTIKSVAATLYTAGADTSKAALGSAFLALVINPAVQKRAQAEIDVVVGRGRLPDFGDYENLPYVNAICMEVKRWHPVVPLGVSHVIREDDVYEGYYIPKGTNIFANLWAILQDPETYSDPDAFKPERFLTSDGKIKEDPLLSSVFGFGRRICPGRHLADATLWIVIASVLSVFTVDHAKDADGKEIPVERAYTDAAISHSCPFTCSIVPRDQTAEGLIKGVL